MFFVGLDVHQKRSSVCILDGNGKKVKELAVLGNWERLVEEVTKLPRPMAICFEASCGYGYLYQQLVKIADRVVVAHPGKLRLIFQTKRKNDRVDSQKLAKILFLDQVPTVYVPGQEVRAWRSLIEFRHNLVVKRTRCKNALRALLRGCGFQTLPPRKGLWAKKGVAVLKELTLPTVQDQLRRELLLEELESWEGQIKRAEQNLDQMAGSHAGVALLQEIPGVGPRTAEAVLAYIDDAQRFTRNKQIGAYFGLVPCQDSSAGADRLGHITREGPATVRGLLIEAAWQGIRYSPTIRRYYEQVRQGKKGRAKIALVATAHHLLRVMLAMLKTGETWREKEPVKTTAMAVAGPV
jgi:transposase